MTEPQQHYPPPDFGGPASTNPVIRPPTFQHQQQSSFHANMWTWGGDQSPSSSNPSWGDHRHGGPGGWQPGWTPPPPPGSMGGGGWGNHQNHQHNGPHHHPYGQNFYRGGRGQGGHRGGRANYGAPYNSQGKRQKNKKEPEFTHFCDTCDRGFKNQDKYDEHMSQHVKCSVSDCNFTAHEKIVAIHWRNNHAPGARRIKLDTPDEIAKWREERRRNYPSLQNVQKKRKLMEIREETGGVLETAQFGRMRGRGRGRGRGGWRGRGRFQGGAPGGGPPPYPGGGGTSGRPRALTQPPREGDPLGALVDSDPDSDREESGSKQDAGLVVAPKQMSSGLGSLVANYGSMTESESDEEPEAIPIQRGSKLLQENQALLKTQDEARPGDTRPPSRATDAQQNPRFGTGPHTGRGRGRGRGGRGGRGGPGGWRDATPQKRRATLLEMLLAPDVRHERNVLLQCVRYIVRNRFFGVENGPQNRERTGRAPAITAVGAASESHVKTKTTEKDCEKEEVVPRKNVCPGEAQDTQVDLEPRARQGTELGEQVLVPDAKDGITDKECHELGSKTLTENVIPSSYVYDDEIWESPGATM